jgi:hypothetical protein
MVDRDRGFGRRMSMVGFAAAVLLSASAAFAAPAEVERKSPGVVVRASEERHARLPMVLMIGAAVALLFATAAAADRDVERSAGKVKRYLVDDGDVIYKGTLVGVNAAGYLVPMSDTASLIYVGVAAQSGDNSAGADGAIGVLVEKEGEFGFVYAGGDATIAKIGDEVYAQDDQTVDEDDSLTTTDYKVGVIQEVISTTHVRIRIDNYVK